ncbi:MAG: hypothetical protein ACEQSB_05000 [Undibacterium sp.]
MSALSKKILNQITQSAVTPTERWKFQLKRGVIWLIAGFVALVASFALALTTHVLFEIDWSVYRELGFSWYQVAQSLSPLLWLFILALFLIAGVVLLRRTRYGYRYSLVGVFSLLLVTGTTMAAVFESIPGEEQIEASFMYKIPGYRNFEARVLPSVEKQWSQPDDGLLGGTITTIEEGESFELRDFKDKTWTVNTGDAVIGESVELKTDQDIKIIGETEDDDTFRATEVRSWKPAASNNTQSSSAQVKPNKETEGEKVEEEKKSEDHEEEVEADSKEEEDEDSGEREEESNDEDHEDSEHEDED